MGKRRKKEVKTVNIVSTAKDLRQHLAVPGSKVIFDTNLRNTVLDIEPRITVEDSIGVSLRGNVPVGIQGTLKFERAQDLTLYNLHFVGANNADLGDNLSLVDSEDCHIRHCTFTGGTDENLQIFAGSKRITVEKSIVYAPRANGNHSKGPHAYGCQITGSSGGTFDGYPDEITLRKCLLGLGFQRFPQIMGDVDGVGGRVRLTDCIIYGWWKFGTKVGRGAEAYLDRCLYVALDESDVDAVIQEVEGGKAHIRDSYLMMPGGELIALGDASLNDAGTMQRVLGLVNQIQDWGAQPHSSGSRRFIEMVKNGEGDPTNPDIDPAYPRFP